MKRIGFFVKTFIICLFLLLFTCEQKFRNPLDPNTELKPDKWAPENFTAEAIDDSHIRLSWTQEESRIEGFIIERKEGTASYREIGRTDTTVFIDDSLKINTNYTYRIAAFAGKNLSTYSNEKSVYMIIHAPTDLNAEAINDQTIRLTWTDNCSFESGFKIERKAGSSNFSQVAEVNANTTTYEESSLTYGEIYTYRVRAHTSLNQSDYSNESLTRMVIPAPTDLNLEVIDVQTIRLTWTDNCSFESGFRIERKIGNGDFSQIAEVGADITSYNNHGLTKEVVYFYRVKAFTLNHESDYSNEIDDPRHIIDFDGNVYNTVKIGNQVWMAENLKVTHYRNGDPIPNVTNNTQWSGLTTGAYCNYDNDPNNAITYGRLYNWYAVAESRNLAPIGWHVPSDTEWQILIDYLGGAAVAGGKLKESGTTRWISPNTGATNESGFTALPGGYRDSNSGFNDLGNDTDFWSSTEGNSDSAWSRELLYNLASIYRFISSRRYGFSVRLVRD